MATTKNTKPEVKANPPRNEVSMPPEEQTLIAELIENYYSNPNDKMKATELLTHLIGQLKDKSDGNPFVQYLIDNEEKVIDSKTARVVAGGMGVEKYKALFDTEMINKQQNERTQAPSSSGPSSSGPSDDNPNSNVVSQKKYEDICKQVAHQWKKDNPDWVNKLGAEKADELAMKIAKASVASAVKNENKKDDLSKAGTDPKNQKLNGNVQPKQAGGGQVEREGNVIAAASRIAALGSAMALGVIGGVAKAGVKGAELGFNALKARKQSAAPSAQATKEQSYASEVLESTTESMFEKTDSLYDSIDEMVKMKDKGQWTIPSEQEKVYSKIERDLAALNTVKNTLKKDLEREGISPEEKKEAVQNLNSVNEFIKSIGNELNENDREKDLKKKADAISKAVERMINAIKDLLFGNKDNDKKAEHESPSYEP